MFPRATKKQSFARPTTSHKKRASPWKVMASPIKAHRANDEAIPGVSKENCLRKGVDQDNPFVVSPTTSEGILPFRLDPYPDERMTDNEEGIVEDEKLALQKELESAIKARQKAEQKLAEIKKSQVAPQTNAPAIVDHYDEKERKKSLVAI